MIYSKQYTGFPDLEWQMRALSAVESAIPCLMDWIKSTGHGEVNLRDRLALRKCLEAIEAHHDAMRAVGCFPDSTVDEKYREAVKLCA